MIGNGKAFSSFSVNDIEKAKDFYVNKLGLTLQDDNGMLSLISKDSTRIMIYPKDNHEAATFTVLNLETDDIQKTVEDLKNLGINMEIYEGMGQDENGIGKAMGEGKIAWFKDPAGNILSVIQN